ncbi:MAG: DUF6498-containing protein [Gemmatimonadota bacterium]|nr:DUF6498-containing protein [Gemmatimonadota bacterium]
MKTEDTLETWASAWPDALAFSVGLAVAWWAGWNAGDLVWSLWLSSLVVGYSLIVWTIAQPAVEIGRGAWKARALAASHPGSLLAFWAILLIGALLGLGFFTVHFGMFHYGHSQLLISFFPIDMGSAAGRNTFADMSTYVEVMRRYWTFLPAAFLAERAAFMRKPPSLVRDLSVAATVNSRGGTPARVSSLMWEPYRNVARMHMLIFFFFFAHFARLENFAVYAVVYAVYFFPWRLVRRSVAEPVPA